MPLSTLSLLPLHGQSPRETSALRLVIVEWAATPYHDPSMSRNCSGSSISPSVNIRLTATYVFPVNIDEENSTDETHTHMDVPWWVGHDDLELSKNRVVKVKNIAVDPLRRKLTSTPVSSN